MFLKIKGFTLIELLIVVAIIAILAAIAVPNFLEAQVRAKVSRCHNDMRSIATAMESYKIDTNQYPPDLQFYQGWTGEGTMDDPFAYCVLGRLTTPIAYITSVPNNVFIVKGSPDHDGQRYQYNAENAWRQIVLGQLQFAVNPHFFNESGEFDANLNHLWALTSVGPNMTSNVGSYAMFGQHVLNRIPGFPDWDLNDGCLYDPTNGTISEGDIVRVGP